MINLLPLRYKVEIKEEENLRVVIILEFLFLVFLISLVLILFSIKIYLQNQVDSLKIITSQEEKVSQTSEIKGLRDKIIGANQSISELKSFYQNQISSVEILKKVSNALPALIYLETLSWQPTSGQITISGFSPTRELLFALKNNLEAEKGFSGVYFPPDNWLEPRDIDFSANFKINKIDSQK